MQHKYYIISTSGNNSSIEINAQSLSIALSAAVSLSVLIGVLVNLVSKFNNVTSEVKNLREDLTAINLSMTEFKNLQKDVNGLDKRHDLLAQSYANRVEAVNLIVRQLDEKIEHKFGRLAVSISDIESFLSKQGLFKVREANYSMRDQRSLPLNSKASSIEEI